MAVVLALTIGGGVAWAALRTTTPSTTTPSAPNPAPSQTTPGTMPHNGHCPNMGPGQSSSSYAPGL